MRGRTFTDAEDSTKPRVIVINRTLAQKYYSGEDPIGQRFGDTNLDPKSIKEIIGIVNDIREGPLDSEIWPAYYLSLATLVSVAAGWVRLRYSRVFYPRAAQRQWIRSLRCARSSLKRKLLINVSAALR